MKLTKQQAKAHNEAVAILAKDKLNFDERRFVFENWHAGANHINSATSAHFTPCGLARDMSINVGQGPVLDLCAGIGALAFAVFDRWSYDKPLDLVCIELNPDYVAVGRKVLPEARWICGDIFDLASLELGHFGTVVSNPPFGAGHRSGSAPRYQGRNFEYHVLDIASDIADEAVFIVPQMSAPFRYSGHQTYSADPRHRSREYEKFERVTGIELEIGLAIDADMYRNDWHDVSVSVEIVTADLTEARARRGAVAPLATAACMTGDLFA